MLRVMCIGTVCAAVLALSAALAGAEDPKTPKDAAPKGTAPKDTAPKDAGPAAKSVLDFTVKSIDGKDVKLADYRGDVLLIVNVASQCGLTERNYTQLEPLYAKYQDKGFRILAFPANNFGGQEPGSNEEIKKFCTGKYNATYDLFAKVSVKGDDMCPLYQYLTKHSDGKIAGDVMWNFQKYLVDRNGNVVAKFDPRVEPNDEKVTKAIEAALAAPRPEKGAGA